MGNIAQILRSPTTDPGALRASLAARNKEICEALRREMRDAGLSSEEFRSRVSELLGVSISQRAVYSWTAPTRGAKFPFVYLDFICQALGNDSLRRLALSPKLRELLELGERAAAILDEHARRRLLKARGTSSRNGGKKNGSHAALVLANGRGEFQRKKVGGRRG